VVSYAGLCGRLHWCCSGSCRVLGAAGMRRVVGSALSTDRVMTVASERRGLRRCACTGRQTGRYVQIGTTWGVGRACWRGLYRCCWVDVLAGVSPPAQGIVWTPRTWQTPQGSVSEYAMTVGRRGRNG